MQEVSSQVCAAHIELIERVVFAIAHADQATEVQPLIDRYRADGWTDLANALSAWLVGTAPNAAQLDSEDAQIVGGIQRALDDPAWLASVADRARAEAAESVADLIYAATWGDHDALDVLAHMRAATQAAGVTNSAADAFVALVEGERDIKQIIDRHPQADPALLGAVFARLEALEAE